MEGLRRMTRSSLSLEPKVVPKVKKNVKFIQPEVEEADETRNTSFSESNLLEASFEDVLFSPRTPSSILRVRHPLPHSWTFWYSAGNKDLTWEQNQIRVCTVATVEDFWFMMNQVQPPSNIPAGYTYSVFRGDIFPDWDHKNNKDGGRWMKSFSKSQRQKMLDIRWMEVLVLLMGDHVGQLGSKLITGAEVCVRKNGDRLELWVADIDMVGIVEVGRLMKERLRLEPKENIQFSMHKENIEGKGRSNLVL